MNEIAETAGIVLTRGVGDELEVFWARRPDELGFMGGFHSYFVGRVEPGDRDVPLDVPADRLAVEPQFYAAALRELFEEAGLLALGDGIAASWATGGREPFGDWANYRTDLRHEAAHLAADFAEAGLELAAERLVRLGGWTTPSWLSRQFHTEFFWLHLSDGESERLDADNLRRHAAHDEVAFGEWVRPAEALERWATGRARMTTPLVAILEILAGREIDAFEGALEERWAQHERDLAMELVGNLRILPLETATLPPATHTNCYLVGGEAFVVVDPGTADAGQIELLAASIDRLLDGGCELAAVVLTHHHRDHVGGAAETARRYGVEVWAHEETAARCEKLDIGRTLADGESIALGDDALVCLHTPGHAPGHLCLYHQRTASLLAGDLVASEGTIVIDPPDGHMGQYMESLERIRGLGARTVFPAHGWAITQPAELLTYYIEHRRIREREVVDALELRDEPATPLDLVPEVYDEVPTHVWPLAARSLLAHLVHLVEQDRAETDGKSFWLTDVKR